MIEHVAIVGGGFSGTLLAINLLRHEGPRATLIERRPSAGAGLAFGAAHAGHLLNVRAGNMSALPDDPDHFVRWLAGQGEADAATRFVPRLLYGRYLQQLLEETRGRQPTRLAIVHGGVETIAREESARLRLADGGTIDADAVVLAIGNLPPHDPPHLDAAALGHDRYRADPWEPGLIEGIPGDGTILIVGTGLTMIDVALSIDAQGFAGRMIAISRRGLVPHVHAAAPAARAIEEKPAARAIEEKPAARATDLLRFVRARAAEEGWRGAVDALRPITHALWRGADADARARFLRHLRPWWDVHRHRLAPDIAARIARMRAGGRLDVHAGKPAAFTPVEGGVEVAWRPRGCDDSRRLFAHRIVNCTGPQADLLRSEDRLLRALLDDGRIRPDALRIGIDVDPQSQVIDARGIASDWLFAVGPMTRGAFWEIVAVPDIRMQSWGLARRLSNAHWVGGEGL